MAIIASKYLVQSFSYHSKLPTEIFSHSLHASRQTCKIYVGKPAFLYYLFVASGTIVIFFAYRFGHSRHYEVVDSVDQKRVIATFTITGRGTIGNFYVVHPVTFARNCLKNRYEVQLVLERLAAESDVKTIQACVKHRTPLVRILTALGFDTAVGRHDSSLWFRFTRAWCSWSGWPVRMSYQLQHKT